MMKAGFSRLDVTPSMGIDMSGYFNRRFADGVLDNLEVNALAASVNDKKLVILSVDNLGINQKILAEYKKIISEKSGIPETNILVSATHIHTGPKLVTEDETEMMSDYRKYLGTKLADAAFLAIDDLKPAKMSWKIGRAADIAYVRRFRMKDGSVRTNPGIGNPDILAPLGDIDDNVIMLRFDRDNADTLVFINFANHPDVIGGTKITADWPGFARRIPERSIPGVKSVSVNGAQGDINHINVNLPLEDIENTPLGSDKAGRCYAQSRHIGNVVAGAVLRIYDMAEYIEPDSLHILEKTIRIPANIPSAEDMPLAHKYYDLYLAGRDDEIPYEGMEHTTVLAEAKRMVLLENGPESFEMKMTGVKLGDIAFITILGEGFNYIGRELKKSDDYKLVIPCGLTNGYEGYFPTYDAYSEGGYEARGSKYKAGVAECIAEEGKSVLSELKNIN